MLGEYAGISLTSHQLHHTRKNRARRLTHRTLYRIRDAQVVIEAMSRGAAGVVVTAMIRMRERV